MSEPSAAVPRDRESPATAPTEPGAADDFKVSVIVPVFNAGRHLVCAVESALQQPEVGEVVLVEDGSSDDSLAVAESLVARHPQRVKLHWHEGQVNQGPGESRNLGLREARCPFVAFLDADDWYLPDCFAFDKAAFEADPGLGMVRHSLGNAWDPEDEDQRWFLGYSRAAREKFCSTVKDVKPEDYFQSLYPMGPLTAGVADVLTVRRELANAVGGFPPWHWAEDMAFHLKLASVGRVAFADMERPMAMRRIHADNLSRAKADKILERLDHLGRALMETMAFLRERKRPFRHKVALHQAWVRWGSRLTTLRSFSLLAKAPEAILSPRVVWLYSKFYASLIGKILQRKLWLLRRRCLGGWRKVFEGLRRRVRGPVLPVYIWQRDAGSGRQNWGDDLNRHLLKALTGIRVEAIGQCERQTKPHFMVIGSVLAFATPQSTVWGTGAIAADHLPAAAPARICAVRGPLTRQALEAAGILCPPVYGDPALLLGRYYRPTGRRHGRVVVVPHYIDAERPLVAKLVEAEQALLLRPDRYGNWLDLVDAIAGASCVFASSLHALIVAEAYGVPAVWIQFSEDVYGGSFKYRDFYASIGKPDPQPVVLADEADFIRLRPAASAWRPGAIDLEPLVQACPFPLRINSFTRTKASKEKKRR